VIGCYETVLVVEVIFLGRVLRTSYCCVGAIETGNIRMSNEEIVTNYKFQTHLIRVSTPGMEGINYFVSTFMSMLLNSSCYHLKVEDVLISLQKQKQSTFVKNCIRAINGQYSDSNNLNTDRVREW